MSESAHDVPVGQVPESGRRPAQPGVIGSLDVHGNPNVLRADHGTSTLGQGPPPISPWWR
jgi:hypothetical protein